MNQAARFLYLHGLCSSPGSSKAAWFATKLRKLGYTVEVPELNVPSFERLTITAQVQKTKSILVETRGTATLIGSSLGGLVAMLVADQLPDKVCRLLLLAPAVTFTGAGLARAAGTNLQTWKQRGYLELLHYRDNTVRKLGYEIVEDASQYDFGQLVIRVPAIVFHGTEDDVVPFHKVQRFMARQNMVRFFPIKGGDHTLRDWLEYIWNKSRDFLLGNKK